MAKLFISQPMRGKTDEEILQEREAAISAAKKIAGEDVDVLDTFFQGADLTKPLEYLGESIKMLAQADIIYLARGWKEARGCRIEHACAIEYGVRCIEAQEE